MMLSITVCAYNRPKLLERCLNSIARQSDNRWQIFITNDNSPNPEVERVGISFVKQYGGGYANSNISDEERLKHCRSAVCINAMMQYLEGDIWWHIADDMELAHARAVGNVLDFFESNPQVRMGYMGIGYRLADWRTGEPIDASTVRNTFLKLFPGTDQEIKSDFTKNNLVIRQYPDWVNYGKELSMAFSILDGGQFAYRRECAMPFVEDSSVWMGEDAQHTEDMCRRYGLIYPILDPLRDIQIISNLNEASLTVQGSPEKSIAVTKC